MSEPAHDGGVAVAPLPAPPEPRGALTLDADLITRSLRLEVTHRVTRRPTHSWAMGGWVGLAKGQKPTGGIQIRGAW